MTNIFVESQLKKLKREKAAGHDDIPPSMLKDAASELFKPSTHLINLSLQTGVVLWKIVKVTPVHE